jgi:uncharacterized membrane protein
LHERRIHQFFMVGIVLKGLHSLIECIAGIVLAFVSTGAIVHLINRWTKEGFSSRHDAVARHLDHIAQQFTPGTKHFYAFYLLSHGVVKLFLVGNLLRRKLWAYPAALAVLGLFIVYQVYRYSFTHSAGLLALTVFDLVVIGLIWREYSVVRRFGGPA